MAKFGNLILHKNKPTIIAEVGVNHGCDFKLAKKYISLANKANADAIKFQTYKADLIASKNSPAYWDLKEEKTTSQYKLFKKFDKFNFKEFKLLKKICDKKKIKFLTTIFDTENVDKYNKLIQVFKISSSDITNVPLLKKIGLKKKHVILSTGASTIKEINFALKILNLPKSKICLMHCVLNYPTNYEDANLNYISVLKKKFPGYLIGYSDHTKADKNLTTLITAYNCGAQIIEKHFSHNLRLKGNDHYHSMNYKKLNNFYNLMSVIEKLKGNFKKNLRKESNSIKFARRGIYIKQDILKNEKFTEKNLITLRPNMGIGAEKWYSVLGKRSKVKLKKGDNLKKIHIN
tara:strand:+ start:264 stop:1304 length:1041 start_codon:yes stop_codon:yes gene_type:complete